MWQWADLVQRQQLVPGQVTKLLFLLSFDEQPESWPLFSSITRIALQIKMNILGGKLIQPKVKVSESVGS